MPRSMTSSPAGTVRYERLSIGNTPEPEAGADLFSGTITFRNPQCASTVNNYGWTCPSGTPQAAEGERMKILSKTGGNPQEQDMAGFGEQWSNDAHLWWIEAKAGDKLELALPVEKAGRYRLLAAITKAVDYGIVQFSLDGEELGQPIDLFNNGVIPTGELDLGTRELTAGEHKLGVEITGANEKAVQSYMFGLDYVRLVPAD